jgi:hypothetical protein
MFCPNRDCPDFKATGRHGEYRQGITICPYCQTALVDQDPADLQQPTPGGSASPADDMDWDESRASCPASSDDLEPVYETSDPSEVAVVRSFLDAQGIPHIVVGEEQFDAFRGSLSPLRFNPRAGSVTFMVAAAFAAAARELLADFDETDDEAGPESQA